MYSIEGMVAFVISKDELLGTSCCRDIAFSVLMMIDLFDLALEHCRVLSHVFVIGYHRLVMFKDKLLETLAY